VVSIAPLLLTSLGAFSGDTAVGAAAGVSAVAVRNTNGWARFTDPATTHVDDTVQPGLAHLGDGTLVVAWREGDQASGGSSLVTTTVAPDNAVAPPAVQLTWPILNADPDVLPGPGGGAEVVFVGNDSAGYFGETNAYRLLVDAAGVVSAPAEERYFAQQAGIGIPLDTARAADGKTVVNQVLRWHQGPEDPSETEDPSYAAAPWNVNHVSIATAGNTTYLAHFATEVPDLVARGIYVGPLAATAAERPAKLPGSWYADQPVALEGSTTGVLWAAYCTGTEACDRLVLRDVTNGRSLTVPTGEYAARITLSPGPNGRMWVVWQSGVSAISAVRTNKAGTRFGPVRRSAPFYTANSIRSLVVDGTKGPADVVVNGRGELWHRRYLAPLTPTASPTSWRVGRKQTVAFTVKDAGDPVSNARVSLAGGTCTTSAAGTCSLAVPARARPATLTATVTRDGYAPASVGLRVVS
jgi:hypothetical protein